MDGIISSGAVFCVMYSHLAFLNWERQSFLSIELYISSFFFFLFLVTLAAPFIYEYLQRNWFNLILWLVFQIEYQSRKRHAEQ